MDAELEIDIDDPNQLLTLLKTKLEPEDTRTVTSLIQNIVVGTALLDKDTRSYMLSMIGKAVMYIVLDQNGITDFTDAFKYSVDQIISGLQEIEHLHEENDQLSAICDHQEKQMMDRNEHSAELQKMRNSESAPLHLFGEISIEKLEAHKKQLGLILHAIRNGSAHQDSGVALDVSRTNSNSTFIESIDTSSIEVSRNAPPPPPMPMIGGLPPPRKPPKI